MKKELSKISKIIDEMFSYLSDLGATKIDLNYQDNPDCYILTFKCNYIKEKIDMIYKMVKYLNMERQQEMESFFWELAGEYSQGSKDHELSLVGMMTDEVKIYFDDDRIEVLLIRIKEE
ncbi:MAG: hypothetical protein JXQ26_07215 [Tissierellales bacterium]|nr:hypothetical protein [Tissierellales bacterium]MBN2827762.1 hypothetical protein [Tissierellales bacterium]